MPQSLSLKILIVTKQRSGGGTEKHVAEVSQALGLDTAYLEDGLWNVCWKLWRGRYDIVHFFLPRAYVLGSMACWLTRSKAIRVTSRRSLRSCYQTPHILRLEKWLHKRTRILVGNSRAVCAELEEEAPNADIRLIYNGISMKPEWLEARAKNRPFTMLCVANAFPYKGHEDLLAALRLAGPSLPEPWVLYLAGKGTERFTGFRVEGLGYCKPYQIALMLAATDLFILPSHEEGCSNALLEAMACGVPVIATDVGGNKDVVIHGHSGWLVKPKDPQSLANGIVYMANNLGTRSAMAHNAESDIAKRFGFERMIDDYRALYRSAVTG